MYRTVWLWAALAWGCGSLKTDGDYVTPLTPGGACGANARPTVAVDEVGDVHPADSPLTVRVGDDLTPPEQLVVRWASEVDGELEPLSPTPDGTVALPVDQLTPGDQALTLEVVDGCGASAFATLATCLQAEIHDMPVPFDALKLSGDAAISPQGYLDLTGEAPAQVGSAFDDRRRVPAGELYARIRFTLGPTLGGDGLSITAADADRLVTWRGGGGCGLGYGVAYDCQTGIPIPGWSVELDTFANDHDPTDQAHVAFTFDGQMDAPVAWAPIPDIGGLAWHELEVTVGAGLVEVHLDGNRVLSATVDPDQLDFPAYLGLTAGTGASYELHRVAELESRVWSCPP